MGTVYVTWPRGADIKDQCLRHPPLRQRRAEQVARTADFAVRVFSVAIIAAAPYSIAVSKLRRPFLSDRYCFIVVRLLRRREKFTEPDFALLARAFNRVSMGLWPVRGHENHLVTPA
jgi:hypothetical protein